MTFEMIGKMAHENQIRHIFGKEYFKVGCAMLVFEENMYWLTIIYFLVGG